MCDHANSLSPCHGSLKKETIACAQCHSTCRYRECKSTSQKLEIGSAIGEIGSIKNHKKGSPERGGGHLNVTAVGWN